MEETLDQISPILPMDIFQVTLSVPHVEKNQITKPLTKKALLPCFSELLVEKKFANVAMSWHESGLVFDVHIDRVFEEGAFPNFRRGDSIELFIDTRDLKTAGFLTKFCHHFVILPMPVDGIQAKEVTEFRTDDRHELCDDEKIVVKGDFKKRSTTLKIVIPSECLHGYEPTHFDRLGFAYRINRFDSDPQHFALSSKYLDIEKENNLWTSIHLEKL